MKTSFSGAALLVLLTGIGTHAYAQVRLSHLKTIDLSVTAAAGSAFFIGNDPSAVAWNGTDAWVGGYNEAGGVGPTAIVPIRHVLGSAVFENAFGQFNTNNSRGLTGLAFQNGLLAASLDNGSGTFASVRGFEAATGTQKWDLTPTNDKTRRGEGVAFDPGFRGSAPSAGNVAFLSIGSGRRPLLNTANGSFVYAFSGPTAGMIINNPEVSTTWRDLTFDPATGDLYARESNRVTKATRTGDNSVAGGSVFLGTQTKATGVDNQNLAFVNSTAFGDFILFNDRTSASSNQAFGDVVKALDKNGNPLPLALPGFTPAPGNGAYDFSFDPLSQTLAITDFRNRRLDIFFVGTVVPEPGTLAFALACLAGTAGFLIRRRRLQQN